MKLYRNLPKRIAKKKNGCSWKKLLYGATLKAGDLASTCRGYNERIRSITPVWSRYNLSKGSYICDFDILSEAGHSCSLVHCCSCPTETKEQVIAYWEWFNTEEGLETQAMWGAGAIQDVVNSIPAALAAGKEVFDENGCPLPEYLNEWEKEQIARCSTVQALLSIVQKH